MAPPATRLCGLCNKPVTEDDYYKELDCSFPKCPGDCYHDDCMDKYLRKRGRGSGTEQRTRYPCPATLANGEPCHGTIRGTHNKVPSNAKKKEAAREAAVAVNRAANSNGGAAATAAAANSTHPAAAAAATAAIKTGAPMRLRIPAATPAATSTALTATACAAPPKILIKVRNTAALPLASVASAAAGAQAAAAAAAGSSPAAPFAAAGRQAAAAAAGHPAAWQNGKATWSNKIPFAGSVSLSATASLLAIQQKQKEEQLTVLQKQKQQQASAGMGRGPDNTAAAAAASSAAAAADAGKTLSPPPAAAAPPPAFSLAEEDFPAFTSAAPAAAASTGLAHVNAAKTKAAANTVKVPFAAAVAAASAPAAAAAAATSQPYSSTNPALHHTKKGVAAKAAAKTPSPVTPPLSAATPLSHSADDSPSAVPATTAAAPASPTTAAAAFASGPYDLQHSSFDDDGSNGSRSLNSGGDAYTVGNAAWVVAVGDAPYPGDVSGCLLGGSAAAAAAEDADPIVEAAPVFQLADGAVVVQDEYGSYLPVEQVYGPAPELMGFQDEAGGVSYYVVVRQSVAQAAAAADAEVAAATLPAALGHPAMFDEALPDRTQVFTAADCVLPTSHQQQQQHCLGVSQQESGLTYAYQEFQHFEQHHFEQHNFEQQQQQFQIEEFQQQPDMQQPQFVEGAVALKGAAAGVLVADAGGGINEGDEDELEDLLALCLSGGCSS